MNYSRFKTDKTVTFPGFDRMRDYEKHLGNRQRKVKLLELGVLKGESLLLWRAFFPKSRVIGIDRNVPTGFTWAKGITVYKGKQDDVLFLRFVGSESGPFDVIVDDCSHLGHETWVSFWTLWPFLREGGLYVIEDWTTGYLKDWPDGKAYKVAYHYSEIVWRLARRLRVKLRWRCHSYGMVGFVKELVDNMTPFDIGLKTNTMHRWVSPFESMVFTPGAVIITKRREKT